MTKTLEKTLTQRVTALEAEVAELKKEVKEVRWLANYNLYDFSKTQGEVSVYSDWIKDIRKRLDELECEESPLPPTLSPEEEKQREIDEREWRIGQ